MKMLSVLMAVLVFSVIGFGQPSTGALQPDQWRGLLLGQAAPERAVELLGQPATDQDRQSFRPLMFNERFDVGKKNFRILRYANAAAAAGENFEEVKLTFENNKLVAVTLSPKQLTAGDLLLLVKSSDYKFNYFSGELEKGEDSLASRPGGDKNFPVNFPEVYFLTLEAEDSYIFAMISNNLGQTILDKTAKIKKTPESVPGKVAVIQLVAKSLWEEAGIFKAAK